MSGKKMAGKKMLTLLFLSTFFLSSAPRKKKRFDVSPGDVEAFRIYFAVDPTRVAAGSQRGQTATRTSRTLPRSTCGSSWCW